MAASAILQPCEWMMDILQGTNQAICLSCHMCVELLNTPRKLYLQETISLTEYSRDEENLDRHNLN